MSETSPEKDEGQGLKPPPRTSRANRGAKKTEEVGVGTNQARADLPPAPFAPQVERIRVHATRRVSTGQFEYLELTSELEARPDPNYKVKENLANYQGLVVQEVTRVAENVAREIQLNRGGS